MNIRSSKLSKTNLIVKQVLRDRLNLLCLFIPRLSLIVPIFYLCFIGVVQAQEKAIFRNLSNKDGLSQSSVFAITQDGEGYIWVGTRDGLNKFDGYHFTTYLNKPNDAGSLAGNDVRVLYFDTLDAHLWAGTYGGLCRYEPTMDTFVSYTEADGLSSNIVRSIFRDSKKRLWIGTSSGLNLFIPGKEQFVPISLDLPEGFNPRIYSLAESHDGNLLLGMAHGLYQLKGNEEEDFELHPVFNQGNDTYGLPDYKVQALLTDDTGTLWVGTEIGGGYRMDLINENVKIYQFENGNLSSLSNNNIRSISKSPTGDIWIGTFVGLNQYLAETDNFHRYVKEDLNPASLSSSSIRTVYFDKRGGLWVGSYYGGVNYYDPALSRFKNYEHLPNDNSLSHNVVSSFIEDEKGNFWIGTEGGGLNYFDREKENFTAYMSELDQANSISGNNVKALLKDGNKLWIGTFQQGLNSLDLNSKNFQNYKHDAEDTSSLSHDNVYGFLKEQNTLWIVTYGGGLNIFDLDSNQFKSYQNNTNDTTTISTQMGRTIIKDSHRRIWIGTERGVNLVRRDSIGDPNLKFQRLLYDVKVYDLFEDKSGLIWVGTFSNGLFALNPNDFSYKQYTEEDGLPGRTIFGILQDKEGMLWLSTNNGLSKFDFRKKVFTNYNHSNGLQNLEYNFNGHYKASTGEMLFGGKQGFTMFQPDEILPNSFIPPLVFTNLKVYNDAVSVNDESQLLDQVLNHVDELTFKYNEAIFSIGISALDFFNPSNIQYAYKLEGLDNDWNYKVGQTDASYTIQRPGTYLFRVKATNSDGIWSEQERELKITVLPPPWLSVGAYIIYAFLFLAAIYGAWYFIRLRNSLHIEKLAKQQQKELNEVKLRFYTDITHEFRTPLTLILGPLDELLNKYPDNGIHKQLQSVKRNAQRLLNLVNQILTFRKLETDHAPMQASKGDIVFFMRQVYLSFEETARLRDINYTFESSEPEITLWFDYDKMEKVIYNLLSNAFKFTPNKGAIGVKIKKQDHWVELIVKDNGNGIKKELHEQIFKRYYEKVAPTNSFVKGSGIGLALSKQMVELHHGTLVVESEVGEGATFIVKIPRGTGHFHSNELLENEMTPQLVLSTIGGAMSKTPDFTWLEEPIEKPTEDAPLILVVEDNEEVLQYIQSIFRKDYNIAVAMNGKEGYKLAKKENPAVIISDVMMPEMDGMEMCNKLKSDIKTSHIPVILLTAKVAQLFKNEGLETGADDYITKPFNPDELRLRVRNIIRSRAMMRKKFVRVMNLEPKEITV
ncbi:MAG: two-component regulator propeller domain-containing protein, partial [Bacteroidota bacterium]